MKKILFLYNFSLIELVFFNQYDNSLEIFKKEIDRNKGIINVNYLINNLYDIKFLFN
jgi:hypothetical protein